MPQKLSEEDKRILKLLLDSEGAVTSEKLSVQLGVPIQSIREDRKRLEGGYLLRNYHLDQTKFGWKQVDLLIYVSGGRTMKIGNELLKREEVISVTRMVGEHSIDLRVEILVRDYKRLLNILEEIKALPGIRDVVWTEVVETIGRKNPPHSIAF